MSQVTALFELQSRAVASAENKKHPPAYVAKRGSVNVNVYGRARDGRIKGPFTIAWRESGRGERKRAMRSVISKAKQFADDKALELANGEIVMLSFTPEDKATYRRASELISCTGKSLEVVAGEYADFWKMLGGRQPHEAIKFFLDNARTGIVPKTCTQIIELFRLEKERDPDIGERWRKTLFDQLDRFAAQFHCPLQQLRADQINDWLCGLPVGKYTRRHYRAAVSMLVAFARQRNFLGRDWSEMDRVPTVKARAVEEIRILTPEQITRLLAVARPRLVPFICLTAFAGIRNEEMTNGSPVLDWRDIRLNERIIYVPKEVGKTGKTSSSRIAPIPDNLAAWLARYARPNGPVCDLAAASDALCEDKKKAGIPNGKNETRNTLRKSFISYRLAILSNIPQVAKEAGTSVAKIQTNYGRPIPESEAKRWFDIWPGSAGVIQLNFALG